MKTKPSASEDFIPPTDDHDELSAAVQRCRGCDLYRNATQGVFGEGPTPAPMMLVGEQPGDKEDQSGHPFVGPAGRILDEVLEEAEIPRDQVYVTNAVKHFKWGPASARGQDKPEPRGKRRLHAKPNMTEIHACRGWLEKEIAIVRPSVIVCLGATAAQLFLGRTFRLTVQRGELLDGAPWAASILATYHPSALLRMMRDPDAYERARREFCLDLAEAATVVRFRRARRPRRLERSISAA